MARRYKRSPLKLKLKKQTVSTVSALMLMAMGGILGLSYFASGLMLGTVQHIALTLFGWARYLLPPLFLLAGFALTSFKTKIPRTNLFIGYGLIFFAVLALTGSGEMGTGLWGLLAELVSGYGAFIIFFVTLVIGVAVFLNTSVDEVIRTFIKGVLGFWMIIKNHLLRGFFDQRGQKQSFDDDKELPVYPPSQAVPVFNERAKSSEKKSEVPKVARTHEPQFSSTLAAQTMPWVYPPLSLLSSDPGAKADRGDTKVHARKIEDTLDSFGIQAKVREINPGPAVTQYAIEIAQGTKLSKITALQNNLALALATRTGTLRLEAPIPGKSLVGIEVPNVSPELVTLRQVLSSENMRSQKSALSVPLGLDVTGDVVVADIARMPHILIAGQTGSGKSVSVNSIIATMLFRSSPQEVKFILIDPKRVEFTIYDGIPHLLAPVIVEVDKVVAALKWAVTEMENRYKQFAQAGAKNIIEYNEFAGFQSMHYIVIVIDELASLMEYAPREAEETICRLAQMARAVGIHLVLSTQRPSVDVVTGLIKANIPARIAFTVSSMTDSRVIIDGPGAEKLLGRGDMLYIAPDQAKPTRIQGTFLSTQEIHKIVDYLKSSGVEPHYTEEVTTVPAVAGDGGFDTGGISDSKLHDAIRITFQFGKGSASLLQRRLGVGYARAARIVDQLESMGVVGPADGSKPREVLIKDPEAFIAELTQKS